MICTRVRGSGGSARTRPSDPRRVLQLYAGAALVMAARLKWDPTAYVVLRQLLPAVYRALAAGLLAGAVLLILLGHLTATALVVRHATSRRVLLILYAVVMMALVLAEVGWALWTTLRVEEWLRGPEGQDLLTALEVHEHLVPLFSVLGRLHPLPQKLHDLIQEVEKDVPCNAYVAAAGAALLVALQGLAVVLALLLAHYSRSRTRRRDSHSFATTTTTASTSSERAPLRTAYRNGRIVVV